MDKHLDIKNILTIEDILNQHESLSREELREGIENLGLSREDKGLLWRASKALMEHKGELVAIGRKVVEIVIGVAKRYPNTMAGLVVGSVIATLLYSIPLLGLILGPALGPFALLIPTCTGLVVDFKLMITAAPAA